MRSCSPSALLLPVLLVTGTTGCLTSSSIAISDPRDACLKDPGAYDALQPQEIHVDRAGSSTDGTGRPPAVALRVERRDCMFRVHVQSARGTGTFGPYERVEMGEVYASLGGGHYAFVAHRTEDEVRAVVDGVEHQGHRSIARLEFSENRAHAAYVARDGDTLSLWLDGKEIAHGPAAGGAGALHDVLGVLNDGRVAYTESAPDGRNRLVVGSWKSAPYDNLTSTSIWRGERFTAFLQHGTQWEALLDSRQEKLVGSPAYQVTFSPDGAHAMYLVYRGDTAERRYEAVVDGVAIPLPTPPQASTPNVGFIGSLPYMYLYPPPASTDTAAGQPQNQENGILVLGVKTPAATPTRDQYTADHAGRDGTYVQIGASKGPQLAQVDLESLHVDEQGRVRYRGRQGSAQIEVVDNVVQTLPLVAGAAPALKVPDATAQVALPEVDAGPR